MLRLKQLGGSHAASPLRWRGSFGASFGSTFAVICFSFLYRLYPCLQRLHLGLLQFFSSPGICNRLRPETQPSMEWSLACLVSVQGAQDSRGPL